ncbi:hypothetical protein ACWERI_38425 [Streptomyces collinus]
MRRTTSFTRLCGSASLVCAALALILVFARHDAPAPRWDVLAALGAGAVAAGAWGLACRAAPLLGPSAAPAVPGQPAEVPPPPPRRLPSSARDTGRTAGALLLLVTPLVLARLAAGSGGVFSGVVILLRRS